MDLISSFALVILLGLGCGRLMEGVKLPSLLGYLGCGLLLGRSGFDLLGAELLALSPDLRQIALILILLKAGFSLSFASLKKVGRPVLLLSFLPASLEILSCVLLSPLLFSISWEEGFLMGTILSAVSPAVVVPRMVAYLEKDKNSVPPAMVLAGASLDDIFVVVLFGSALALVTGGESPVMLLGQLPLMVVFSGVVGWILGGIIAKWQGFYRLGGEQRILLLLGLSFALVGLEEVLPLSPLLCILILALRLQEDEKMSADLQSLWKGAELFLFVLLAAEVEISYALTAGGAGLILLVIGLFWRNFGVKLALCASGLGKKEKQFVSLSYLPKATVQAGIGGVPLALGLDCGILVLTMAVLSILVTAPLGACLLDRYGEKLLEHEWKRMEG